MQNRSGVYRWGPALFAVLLAAAVGMWSYNLGLSHGLVTQLPPAEAGLRPWGYYHPWGVGPFFPLFFLAFCFVAMRLVVRGGHRRGGWRSYTDDRGVPPMFEEWHRRAHERDSRTAPPAQS